MDVTVQERGVVRDDTEDSDLNPCRGGRVNHGAEELVLGVGGEDEAGVSARRWATLGRGRARPH